MKWLGWIVGAATFVAVFGFVVAGAVALAGLDEAQLPGFQFRVLASISRDAAKHCGLKSMGFLCHLVMVQFCDGFADPVDKIKNAEV